MRARACVSWPRSSAQALFSVLVKHSHRHTRYTRYHRRREELSCPIHLWRRALCVSGTSTTAHRPFPCLCASLHRPAALLGSSPRLHSSARRRRGGPAPHIRPASCTYRENHIPSETHSTLIKESSCQLCCRDPVEPSDVAANSFPQLSSPSSKKVIQAPLGHEVLLPDVLEARPCQPIYYFRIPNVIIFLRMHTSLIVQVQLGPQ